MANPPQVLPSHMIPGLMPPGLYSNERTPTNHLDCVQKTVLSGVVGFGAGGLFGLFMASMSYDTPFATTPGGGLATTSSLPMRQQVLAGFKDMGARSWSMARNFGKIGALFSGVECAVEGLRATSDPWNGLVAGCLTGGIISRNAGPFAAATGCAGFAAFSAAIDAYMRSKPAE